MATGASIDGEHPSPEDSHMQHQIIGTTMPVLEFTLGQGESVVAAPTPYLPKPQSNSSS